MTLVLSELSDRGITMAADSAITCINRVTGLAHISPRAACKLQPIPYLQAGLSCWGAGEVVGVPADKWLADFIDANRHCKVLRDFTDRLATALNGAFPRNPNPNESRMGVHVSGYEDQGSGYHPSFYHVHDGHSEVLAARGKTVDPAIFNANHDIPVDLYLQKIRTGRFPITRNGDFQIYAEVFRLLESLFVKLRPLGIVIPNSLRLEDRAEYLIFQIRTISELYRLSNLVPGIGGEIRFLTIDPSGISSEGIRRR